MHLGSSSVINLLVNIVVIARSLYIEDQLSANYSSIQNFLSITQEPEITLIQA